jgi:hypothetical protein
LKKGAFAPFFIPASFTENRLQPCVFSTFSSTSKSGLQRIGFWLVSLSL